MALLGSTFIEGFLSSARYTGQKIANAFGKIIPEVVTTFISGFGGQGWAIRNTGTDEKPEMTAEFDNLRIRGTMSVYELVIQKIRAVCGALGISQACGKVEDVTEDNDYYYLWIEGDETSGYGGFQIHDLVRCQRWTSNGVKGYWVEVSNVTNNGHCLVIPKSEFEGYIVEENETYSAEQVSGVYNEPLVDDSDNMLTDNSDNTLDGAGDNTNMVVPAKGDELVQYGNTVNENRRTAIYLHATEDSQPAMDILFGISSKSFAGCLKVRLGGGLPGSGDVGLYCEDGHILAKSGDKTLYEFAPSGNFTLGNGKITYDASTDKLVIGEGVTINFKAAATNPNLLSGTNFVRGISAWSVNDGLLVDEHINGVKSELFSVIYGTKTDLLAQDIAGALLPSTTYTLTYYVNEATTLNPHGGTIQTSITSPSLGGGVVDTSVDTIVDGEAQTTTSDGVVDCGFSKGSWQKHTITFKTAESIPKDACFVMRYAPVPWTSTDTVLILICSIKLESGSDSTPWMASETDLIGDQGEPGEPGETGKGITSVDTMYATSSDVDTRPEDSEFTYTSMASLVLPSKADLYLWSADKVTYTDATTALTAKSCLGQCKTLANVTEQYGTSESSTTTPSSWVDNTFPTGLAEGTWIWTRNQIEWSNGRKTYTDAKLVGYIAKNGTDASVPAWVKEWDGHTTEIGGTYIVTPQAFFGEKGTDAKLTGVLMGARAVTIDGVSQTGFFALASNEVKVAIDPVNSNYLFRGNIVADQGSFGGAVIGSFYKKVTVITKDNFWEYFEKKTWNSQTIVIPIFTRIGQVVVFNSAPDDAVGTSGDELYISLPPYYKDTSTYGLDSAEDYAAGLAMLGSVFVFINRTSGEESITLHFQTNTLFCKSGYTAIVRGFTVTSTAIYLTCKVNASGVVYYEYLAFAEKSDVPSFDPKITPFTPWSADPLASN